MTSPNSIGCLLTPAILIAPVPDSCGARDTLGGWIGIEESESWMTRFEL
jgi:hypothetical protein